MYCTTFYSFWQALKKRDNSEGNGGAVSGQLLIQQTCRVINFSQNHTYNRYLYINDS